MLKTGKLYLTDIAIKVLINAQCDQVLINSIRKYQVNRNRQKSLIKSPSKTLMILVQVCLAVSF
ncbi:hypothetical protein CU280_16020 [Yersinia mollaretii]|nr:hypothetical protein CU280_16020 [Yersinia mollaretii]